ncbi:hypothetical protein ZIOFF_027011 [Zingiber officinale]|uniref:Cyclin-like domain-containing protein n=1 Tax=Zingiber officinale TaxID=94328 RepID=A0A8J5H5M8_ZINOF|nr:hypothetical protein ZIOFF_027011 [Zingiber officinale]
MFATQYDLDNIDFCRPQVTTATAIVYCHRFYLHQSHAENDWQLWGHSCFHCVSLLQCRSLVCWLASKMAILLTIAVDPADMDKTVATACMFLASKVEETPCRLDKIVVIAYETMHKSDPSAAGRIREKATFQKQKDLVLIGERVLLSTIRFDFNVLHPYKPLLEALKKFGITQREVRQTAWNLVNDWLWTTFYVQYKPHYIAASSLFLAAKLHNIKLPSERGYVWWHEFDIIPRQLEGAIQEMCQLLQCNRKSSVTSFGQPVQAPVAINEKQFSSSPDSVLRTTCISSNSSSQDSNADLNSHKHTDLDCHIQTNFSSSEKKKIYLECRTGPQCHKTGTDIPTAAAKHNGTSVDKQSMRKREHIQSMFGEIDKDRIQATIKRKREREVPVLYLLGRVNFGWIISDTLTLKSSQIFHFSLITISGAILLHNSSGNYQEIICMHTTVFHCSLVFVLILKFAACSFSRVVAGFVRKARRGTEIEHFRETCACAIDVELKETGRRLLKSLKRHRQRHQQSAGGGPPPGAGDPASCGQQVVRVHRVQVFAGDDDRVVDQSHEHEAEQHRFQRRTSPICHRHELKLRLKLDRLDSDSLL